MDSALKHYENQMSNFLKKAVSYEDLSEQHYDNAASALGIEQELLFLPYYNDTYHTSSLLYPLCHTVKTLIAAGRILQGTFLLVEALFNDEFDVTSAHIATGLVNELATFALDIMHIIASTLSFISRTASSLIYGYSQNTMKNTLNNPFALFGPSPAKSIKAFVTGVAINIVDEELYQLTTQLSI